MPERNDSDSRPPVVIPLLVLLLIRFLPWIGFVCGFGIAFLFAAYFLYEIRGDRDLTFLALIPALAFGMYVKVRTKVSSRIELNDPNERK